MDSVKDEIERKKTVGTRSEPSGEDRAWKNAFNVLVKEGTSPYKYKAGEPGMTTRGSPNAWERGILHMLNAKSASEKPKAAPML